MENGQIIGNPEENEGLPSGKRLHNYGTSPIFKSYVTVYQRVVSWDSEIPNSMDIHNPLIFEAPTSLLALHDLAPQLQLLDGGAGFPPWFSSEEYPQKRPDLHIICSSESIYQVVLLSFTYCIYLYWLVVWTPLKNRNVNWDDDIPNISGKISHVPVTTNQYKFLSGQRLGSAESLAKGQGPKASSLFWPPQFWASPVLADFPEWINAKHHRVNQPDSTLIARLLYPRITLW